MRIPQATDLERSLIATMLFDESAVQASFEMLRPDDFYDPYWRMCYEMAIELYMNMKPVDMITLSQVLSDRKKDDRIFDIVNHATPKYEYLISVIKEKAIRRGLIQACRIAMTKAEDEAEDIEDLIDEAQKKMFDLRIGDTDTLKDMAEILHELSEYVSQLQERGEGTGLQSGLDLDNILKGFEASKLYIIGARPSMGKTALVMTIMRRLAKQGKKSGLLSLETSHRSLGFRLASQVSGVSVDRLSSGKLMPEELDKFLEACKTLSNYGIYIDDKAAITAEQMRAKCQAMKQKGCEMIFVDFLQLVKTQARSKHEEIGQVSKVLKAISKDLNIPVVALSQLSRKVEERTDKRPLLSDLRESGSIEEDADVVMFLYRPEYYGIESYPDGSETKGVAEIIISKNKDGKTGIMKHFFNPECMRFENISRSEGDAPF